MSAHHRALVLVLFVSLLTTACGSTEPVITSEPPTAALPSATSLPLAATPTTTVPSPTATPMTLTATPSPGSASGGLIAFVSTRDGNGEIYIMNADGSGQTNLTRHDAFVLDQVTMEVLAEIPVPGAHGAGMARNGSYFYTSNLPGGGNGGLVTIDTRTNTVIGEATNTPYPISHNIALTPNNHKLYLTHSGGAADKVTVYTMKGNDPVPVLAGEFTVGLNPFGLAYVP